MIELLLDAGMPLDGAAASEILAVVAEHKILGVIELFERRGAPLVSTNSARLIVAARQGNLQLVHELFRRELDPMVLHGTALRVAVQHRHLPVVAALLEHGPRVGPVPAEAGALRRSLLSRTAYMTSMGIFRLLVDHVTFDAYQLTEVLRTLLTKSSVCEPAVRLLLDRYAGTLLSVDDLRHLLRGLPDDGPGVAVLRSYNARSAISCSLC